MTYAFFRGAVVPGGSRTCTLVAVVIAEHASEGSDVSAGKDGAALGAHAVIKKIDATDARRARHMTPFYDAK